MLSNEGTGKKPSLRSCLWQKLQIPPFRGLSCPTPYLRLRDLRDIWGILKWPKKATNHYCEAENVGVFFHLEQNRIPSKDFKNSEELMEHFIYYVRFHDDLQNKCLNLVTENPPPLMENTCSSDLLSHEYTGNAGPYHEHLEIYMDGMEHSVE